MLSFFRRGGAASILGGAIVFAIILVFALEFRPGRQGAGAALSEQCVVRVHDLCVDEKEFLAAYRLLAPPGAEAKKLRQIGLRSQVIHGLVERELLLREAERLGISISEEEIDDELTRGRAHVSLPAAHARQLAWQLGLCPQPRSPLARECEPGGDIGVRLLPVRSSKTGKFEYAKYERVVRTTTNRGAKEFKEMMRRELIAERMRRLVQSRVRVGEAEAFMVYEREFTKATVQLVKAKREWFARFVADASDSAVDAWAAENEEQVTQAWKADQDRFQAGCPLVSEILIESPPGLEESTAAEYREQTEKLAERIEQGDAFEQVAREASEGETAVTGGYLGCLTDAYGEGSQELLDAVAKLEPGSVSPVIETKRGFCLIKLHGRLAEADVETVGRRHTARMLAVRFQAHELAKQFAEELIRRVQAGTELDKATHALTREYLSRNRASAETKQPRTKPGGEEEAAENPPALEDRNRPQIEDSPPFSITGTPLPTAAPGEAPGLKAFELEEPGALHPVPIATDDGWAVMQLEEKTEATREDFEKQKQELIASLRAAKAADALTRFVARLRKAAEEHIEINAEYLKESKDEGEG